MLTDGYGEDIPRVTDVVPQLLHIPPTSGDQPNDGNHLADEYLMPQSNNM